MNPNLPINFSIVLIVKNEEKTLPKLLASLKIFKERGGEIVICDTGSTDKTAQIARDAGCVVKEVGDMFVKEIDSKTAKQINEKFITDNEGNILKGGDKLFDFGSARNYASSLASNDMISNQDADEEYTVLNIDKICKLISDGYEQFEYNFVFSHDQSGGEEIKFVQSKFYNRKKMRWNGTAHEVLQGSAKRMFLDESVLKLEHWQNPETNRSSYIVGLALDCYQDPNNDRNSHYLGRELLWAGKYKSAIKELTRHVDMNKWPAERAESMIYLGDAYGKLNEPEKQVEWYNKAYYCDSSRREPLIKLAQFYQHNNNPQATAVYAMAATQIPWSGFYASFKSHYTSAPHALLYWAKGWLGDVPGAQEHILKALEYEPYNPKFLEDTKYYFEYPDQGISGWMTFEELQFLYNTAKKMDTICEVGSWKGRSTHALLSGCKGTVTAVDTFAGSADPLDWTHEQAKQINVLEEFKKNVGKFTNLKTIVGKSVEVAKTIPDKSFDTVFLDAGHTFPEVVEDIRAWKNKAKIAIMGHDYFDTVWMGVCRAVDEELGGPDEVHETIWLKWLI